RRPVRRRRRATAAATVRAGTDGRRYPDRHVPGLVDRVPRRPRHGDPSLDADARRRGDYRGRHEPLPRRRADTWRRRPSGVGASRRCERESSRQNNKRSHAMNGQKPSLPTPPLETHEIDAELLPKLVAYLRQMSVELREKWVSRISEAQLLGVMSPEEIFSEVKAVYDNYVDALETGSVESLQAYARDLSERIIHRGVETHEVLGIVLLLRDVLARSLFLRYQDDPELLDRILDSYEPAANRIAVTVGVSFVEERERVIREQQAAIRELSTPVLQVRERLVILPIIGAIDPQRARQLTEQLLAAIQTNRARVVVIDITGVAALDSSVANHLVQTVEASRLLGATVIVT